jgi:hypothetical protein
MDEVLDLLYDAANKISGETVLNKPLSMVHFAYPISGQEGEFVQVDLMPTDNLDYSKWSYYSPAEWESQWKGLYRNELIYATAKHADLKVLKTAMTKDGVEMPGEYERYQFDLAKGLRKVIQSNIGKKGYIVKTKKTIDSKIISKDPKKIAEILFGPGHPPSELLRFEDVLKVIMDDNFIYKKNRDDILLMATDGIIHKGYPVPKELEKYTK